MVWTFVISLRIWLLIVWSHLGSYIWTTFEDQWVKSWLKFKYWIILLVIWLFFERVLFNSASSLAFSLLCVSRTPLWNLEKCHNLQLDWKVFICIFLIIQLFLFLFTYKSTAMLALCVHDRWRCSSWHGMAVCICAVCVHQYAAPTVWDLKNKRNLFLFYSLVYFIWINI